MRYLVTILLFISCNQGSNPTKPVFKPPVVVPPIKEVDSTILLQHPNGNYYIQPDSIVDSVKYFTLTMDMALPDTLPWYSGIDTNWRDITHMDSTTMAQLGYGWTTLSFEYETDSTKAISFAYSSAFAGLQDTLVYYRILKIESDTAFLLNSEHNTKYKHFNYIRFNGKTYRLQE